MPRLFKGVIFLTVILAFAACSKGSGVVTIENVPDEVQLAPKVKNPEKEKEGESFRLLKLNSVTGLPKDLDGNGVLGRGFSTQTGEFRTHECAVGKTVIVDAESTTSSTVLKKSPNSALGFDLKSRIQLNEDSIQRDITKLLTPAPGVSSAVYSIFEKDFGSLELREADLSLIGVGFRDNKEKWDKGCADKFVSKIKKVAATFLVARVEFESDKVKEKFESKNGISLDQDDFSKIFQMLKLEDNEFNFKLVLSAYQLAGAQEKIYQAFASSDYPTKVQCERRNISLCEAVMEKLIFYSRDQKSGFSTQLVEGASAGPALLPSGLTQYN